MSLPIKKTLAPGIYELKSGALRVKVAYGDRQHGGLARETSFPKGTSLREMQKWQTDTLAALHRQKLVPARGTLNADIPRYLDSLERNPALKNDRKSQLAAWSEQFGEKQRHRITRHDVREQVKAWERAGVAASTIRHRMTALSKLYEQLDGEDANNPVQGVKRPAEPEPEVDSRSPDVIERVLDELWYRAAMNNRGWKTLARALVLTHTGMRPSQLKRLVPDVDILPYLTSDVPHVVIRRPGKHGKAHLKPLTADGVAAFLLLLRVGAVGKFSTSAFHKSWWLACDQANVARFHPYLLRHSYATLLRRGGADIADVQELLGHKSPKTTQRYAQVVPEKLVAATQRLEQMWKQSRGQVAWAKPQPIGKKVSSDN